MIALAMTSSPRETSERNDSNLDSSSLWLSESWSSSSSLGKRTSLRCRCFPMDPTVPEHDSLPTRNP